MVMNKEREIIKERPVIRLSVPNMDIVVEEGRVYRGTLVVESTNGVPMEGRIYSTNDKVETEIQEIAGLRQEIPYYFKGKLAVAGNEWQGDLILITNGGEFNVPYQIHVVRRQISSESGPIGDMDAFLKLYAENRKEAREIFFLPAFEQAFLKDEPEKRTLYHGMMMSRSRNMIVEEFLTAAGYKDVTWLEVEEQPLVLDVGKEKGQIHISLKTDGYTEGRISCEKGQVVLRQDRFTTDDFLEGEYVLTVEKNKNIVMGSDVVHIRTARQDFSIPVEWWGTLPAVTSEKEKERSLRRQKADLIHNYLYFRTGSIGEEDFFTDSIHVLEDLYLQTQDLSWRLYHMHLYLMQRQIEAAGELAEEIEKGLENHELNELMEHYYLYLKTMYHRTPETIHEAVMKIRQFYENSEYKAESLWMLIYLDREYVYNKRLQYDTIRQLFDQGSNSSLLYYEACEILNDNPDYMEELGSFEINIFRWGLRYGFVSMPLSCQFARLAQKQKYFNKAVFYIVRKLYSIQKEELFLQVICSLLIKGNRTSKDYHSYFREAVNANLKIIGLNEFYIRSMDFDTYEIIPQKVLIYFTYSNSLDYNEKAYLYTNIYKNREEYDEVYGAYYSKMIPFAQEQLIKGRISEHLAFLYTCFQQEIMEAPENWKAVCDILFYKKIICKNPNMIGVYVSCPETGEEVYTPLSQGTCCAEIFNERTICYFTDSAEQRYVSGIDYEIRPFLSIDQFPRTWVDKNLTNKKVLLGQSGRLEKSVEADELPIMKRIVFNNDYREWMRMLTLERLLRYFENHQLKEDLAKWLDRVDYSNISPSFRKTLMDYYMETGMIENAFFGIELYGCSIMGASKRLKLALFGIHHHVIDREKEDEVTLSLAYSAFIRKKFNRDTLAYLMEHFQGELEDLLLIWERSRKFELPTRDLEKRILSQSIFTSASSEGIFPVYASLYESHPEEEILRSYLLHLTGQEADAAVAMPDYMHQIIGQEILHGRIQDRQAMVHYLYYFAGKTEWYDRIQDAVTYIIDRFLEEEFYLPVYHEYRQWLALPICYEEMTFLTYQGERGKKVSFFYEIDQEEDSYGHRDLMEVLPGMYVCQLFFFQKDHVNYRLEEEGQVCEDKDRLKFQTFSYEGEDSRFFVLNHLGMADVDLNELDQYLLKAYFADSCAKRV